MCRKNQQINEAITHHEGENVDESNILSSGISRERERSQRVSEFYNKLLDQRKAMDELLKWNSNEKD